MLVDESLFNCYQTFKVHDMLNHLFDHCPISSVSNLQYHRNSRDDSSHFLAPKRFKWDALQENNFQMKLACEKI